MLNIVPGTTETGEELRRMIRALGKYR